jgi:hypothetical protein
MSCVQWVLCLHKLLASNLHKLSALLGRCLHQLSAHRLHLPLVPLAQAAPDRKRQLIRHYLYHLFVQGLYDRVTCCMPTACTFQLLGLCV